MMLQEMSGQKITENVTENLEDYSVVSIPSC